MLPIDLPIRCSCGALHGVLRGVSPQHGNRCICYCDDCQSFAYFLERANEILDANGGTDIFQMSLGRLEISEGADRLACMQLTKSGLLRWYTKCCNTPIGNTLHPGQVPFLGLIHSCTDHTGQGQSRDTTLGPVRMRVNAQFATGERKELDCYERAPLSMLCRVVGMLLLARLRGEHAHSPFVDPETGELRASPHILTEEELRMVAAAQNYS